MKNFKLILILVAALGMAVTSCKKDDEDTDPADLAPSINFKGGDAYISGNATVIVGEEFTIGINASSNVESDEKLVSVNFTKTANNQIEQAFDSVFSEKSYNVDYIFTMDVAGEAVYMFEVTDKDGEKSSVSLTITAEAGTTDLTAPEVTYFERSGGNAATGLDGFGLKWENNLKVVSAVIAKDAATKLVQLSADAWTTFTTVEELVAAIDAAEDMADYRGISVEAAGTYNEVLGVINNGEYYMIHLTSSEITVETAGTVVKIHGESKK